MLLPNLPHRAIGSTVNIAFFGSDLYSLEHLRSLRERETHHNDVAVAHVITSTKDTPVYKYCNQYGLECTLWPRKTVSSSDLLDLIIQRVTSANCDTGLVVSFGRFIPPSLLRCFPNGCINVHPSLLPRWRGPCPLLHTLISGDHISGISVVKINPNESSFDSGSLLRQTTISISHNPFPPKTPCELAKLVIPESVEAMFEVILNPNFPDISCVSQSTVTHLYNLKPTYASKPVPEMGFVNWYQQSPIDIIRLWYALQGSSVQLKTQLTLSMDQSNQTDHQNVAYIRFPECPILVTPKSVRSDFNQSLSNEVTNCYLNEAYDLLNNLQFHTPPGTIIYLRTQNDSKHHLIPLMFVSCKPDQTNQSVLSWLAVQTILVDWPGSGRVRHLTAVEFHNGYLMKYKRCTDSVIVPPMHRLLVRGRYCFGQLTSVNNPFLIDPLIKLNNFEQLSDNSSV